MILFEPEDYLPASANNDGGEVLVLNDGSNNYSLQFHDGTNWMNILNIHTNVKTYGAKGDGVADDTTAIQAAIDAVETAGGGVVSLPRGTYLVSSTLTLKNSVYLVGVGRSETTIQSNNAAGADIITIATGLRSGGIEGLYITGATGGGAGIQFESDVARLIVKNVTVYDTGSDGIKFANTVFLCTFIRVEANSTAGHGWNAPGGAATIQNNAFINCHATHNDASGWNLTNVTNCALVQCTADSNADAGFLFVSARVTLDSCQVEANTTYGFRAAGVGRAVLINCRAYNQSSPLVIAAAADVLLIGPETASTPTDYSLVMTSAATGQNLLIAPSFDKPISFASGARLDRVGENIESPAALGSGDTDDYDIGDATVLRLTPDGGGSTITGFAGGWSGRLIRIISLGANLVLSNQDAGSVAANRILSPTGANVTLATDDVASLFYDSTTERWRVINVLT